jgi:DNA-binding protein Fis
LYKHVTPNMIIEAIKNSTNKKIASSILGISKATLRNKIKHYGMEREVVLCQVSRKSL